MRIDTAFGGSFDTDEGAKLVSGYPLSNTC